MRKNILEMSSFAVPALSFWRALSIVEIVASIFCYMMKIDKKIHPGMKEIGLYLAKDTHV